MTGYIVDTDNMRSHAAKLRTIKSDVDEAASAGRTTALDGESFGLLCSFLYPPAAAVQGASVLSIAAIAAALSGAASAITAVANGYDTMDDELSGELTKLLAAIPTEN
jgi:hypothetical protein